VPPLARDCAARTVAVVAGGQLCRALWLYGRRPVGRHLRRRGQSLGMRGAFEPWADDSFQGIGLGGARYGADRLRCAGTGRVVAGSAGAGDRLAGAGLVQHDVGGVCGGDWRVAPGAWVPRRL
ncbi:hypothetical protein, partial [Pseudomonas fluorescens]